MDIKEIIKEINDKVIKELPSATHEITGCEVFNVKMRDEVSLVTKVYFPNGDGPWPAILIRYPYPSNEPIYYAAYSHFVEHGYVLIMQSARGTGESEGKWEPFFNERNDGIDTANWLVKQKWQNGNIGMFGSSYLSFCQWMILDSLPSEVKTLVIDCFGTERYEQIYMNGMFRHDIYTSWAYGNSGLNPKEHPGELYQKGIYMRPHIDADKELFGGEIPFYREYVSNVESSSEYWTNSPWATLKEIPSKIKVPMLLIDGWFDHHLDGLVKGYLNLSEDVKSKSRLIIGPWDHMGNSPGELEYPNNETIGFLKVKAGLEWFDYMLKGKHYKDKVGSIDAYVVGKGQWETLETWPPKSEIQTMYFEKSEEKYKGGPLSENKPSNVEKLEYKYDPDKYIMTNGGTALLAWITPGYGDTKQGARLQEEPGYREDVLTFISEEFSEDKKIVGNIKVKLKVSTDAEDTAFAAKVMVVLPDGRSFNICDGISSLIYRNKTEHALKYVPNEIVEVQIEMWPVSWCISKGAKLRVDISSSNFPAYNNHTNIKGNWAKQNETFVANQTVYVGNVNSSSIELPIIE